MVIKLELKYYPDPILTTSTKLVEVFDENLANELEEMSKIMIQHKGMGISANQVGLSKRMFLMKDNRNNIIEFVNPKITEKVGVVTLPEGCLSSPGVSEIIFTRPQELTVQYQTRTGEYRLAILTEYEAVCAEHECDHLDGVFWFTKLPSRQVRRRVEAQYYKKV
jgi:peptide deformylase